MPLKVMVVMLITMMATIRSTLICETRTCAVKDGVIGCPRRWKRWWLEEVWWSMKVIEQAVYKESEREPGNQCSASPGAATEGGGPMCQVDHTITLSTYCRSYYHPFYIFSHHLYHSFWKARQILRALVSLISYHHHIITSYGKRGVATFPYTRSCTLIMRSFW